MLKSINVVSISLFILMQTNASNPTYQSLVGEYDCHYLLCGDHLDIKSDRTYKMESACEGMSVFSQGKWLIREKGIELIDSLFPQSCPISVEEKYDPKKHEKIF